MLRLAISSQSDVEHARRAARSIARKLSPAQAEMVVLAVSELATNLIRYAGHGEVWLTLIKGTLGDGVEVQSRDTGPGIRDAGLAMQDGFSTGGGLGGGLPGVRRLMDEFSLETGAGGTTIICRIWPRPR